MWQYLSLNANVAIGRTVEYEELATILTITVYQWNPHHFNEIRIFFTEKAGHVNHEFANRQMQKIAMELGIWGYELVDKGVFEKIIIDDEYAKGISDTMSWTFKQHFEVDELEKKINLFRLAINADIGGQDKYNALKNE
jgi:hypothetical protein